jgi:division protein CdvB (Snf7/Vps24/ESCRT-III family)
MERDKHLISKLTDSYSLQKTARTNVYANELSKIRETEKYMMKARLTLNKMALRLNTIHQLGNVAATLSPAIKDLKNIQKGIGSVLPNAEGELGLISEMLNEIVNESTQSLGANLNSEAESKEATEILKEAAVVAEQTIKNKLPYISQPRKIVGIGSSKHPEA